jgi:non-heme chloroperoxidase
MTRLVERLGGPPAFRDPSAPETLPLLADHARQDWRDVVRRFPLPLLMLAGRDSQIWPCEHAAAAVADAARGRALVIEDAGHAISFDQPDRFNEALLAFLADVDADAPPAGDPGRETAGAR